jgi:hypothetical protein
MTPADLARNNAISLEAKKDALSQRQSGDWRVSFTVQGIDMDTRLTQAPMGTRYAVVLVEIGPDELPVQKEARAAPDQEVPPSTRPDRAKHGKIDWRDVQPAAQAGIRCNEAIFGAFLREKYADDWRETAGFLSGGEVTTEGDRRAECVRLICGVESRSELSTDHKARVIWKMLDDEFSAWKALEHA